MHEDQDSGFQHNDEEHAAKTDAEGQSQDGTADNEEHKPTEPLGIESSGWVPGGGTPDEMAKRGGSEPPGTPSIGDEPYTAGSEEAPEVMEERPITELLYGVLTKPVETLRYIANRKLVIAGILTYLAVAFITAIASLPGTITSINENPALQDLPFFDPQATIIGSLVGVPIGQLFFFFIMVGVFHLVAILLKGKGSFAGLLSAVGFANFPLVLSAPFGLLAFVGGAIGGALFGLISFAFAIWVIVLEVIAIRENYGFSTRRAVLTFAIPVLVVLGLVVLLVVGIVILIFGTIGGAIGGQ